jgi:hydroxyacylglutathione hydrolase
VIVEHFAVGALGCNCTLLIDGGDAIVIDCGDEVERVTARLEHLGARARYLVHTHAHIDHIGAIAELRERTGAPGLLHPADLPLYETIGLQARWFGLAPPQIVKLDGELLDGDALRAGNARLEVLHTPGHTHGSVSFAVSDAGAAADRRTLLLTGDTLFRGAIGRWDIGGTSQEDIVHSIREKLLPYPDATVVVPGHGPLTTIGRERRENPYLTGTA